MHIDKLRSVDELRAFACEWHELFHESQTATPFQSPDWLLAWCRAFTPETVCTVVARDGRGLVGVAPVYLYEDRACLLGNGISDYLDIVCRPDAGNDFARVVLDQFPRCEFNDLSDNSPLVDTASEVRASEPCPVVCLCTWRMSSKRAHNLRNAWRRLTDGYRAEFSFARPEETSEYLDALFRYHKARWDARGEPGVLDEPRLQEFHREVADAFERMGMLRLYGIRIGGELKAVLYCFARHGRVYYYLGGFDPALYEYSPGSLLIQKAMEHARDAGEREFDFLRGAEAYKYVWGAVDRLKYRIVLAV